MFTTVHDEDGEYLPYHILRLFNLWIYVDISACRPCSSETRKMSSADIGVPM